MASEEFINSFLEKDQTKSIIAMGTPPLDAEYINWTSDDENIVSFTTTPECPDQETCSAELQAHNPGKTKIRVTLFCTTTGQSVDAEAEVVVAKIFKINVTTFIPYDFGRPGFPIFFARTGATVNVVGAGNNRPFLADAPSFRTRQTGSFRTETDPIEVGDTRTVAASTTLHLVIDSSMGTIDVTPFPVTVPGVLENVSVTPMRASDDTIRVSLSGSAHTAFLPLGLNIDWCYTIEIHNPEGEAPSFTITGGNDDYPAYEVYVDGRRIHESMPVENNLFLLAGGCTDKPVP